MQTSVQKPNSIRLGSVIFEGDFGGGYVNLGALKGAVLNVSISSMQLVFDNAKMEPRNKINELTLTASLYEFNLQNFNEITGLGAFSSVDGTQTSATQSIEGVNAGQAVALEHQNGDGTPITSLTSITAGGTAFTNYEMITLEDGRSAVLFNAAASNVVMTYNYTPLVSKQLLFRDVIKSQKLSKFRFINTNEEGKRLIIEFPKGYSSGDSIELPFQADETTDDAANFPITIKAFPTKDQELCRITDEQDIL